MDGVSIKLNAETAQQAKATAERVRAQEQLSGPRNTISTRIGGTTERVVIQNGKLSSSTESALGKGTTAPIQSAEIASKPSNSNLVTGREPGSSRDLSGDDLKPSSVVKLGNMESSLSALAAAGFVAKNEHGQWIYTDKARAAGHQVRQTDGQSKAEPTQRQEPQQDQKQEQPKGDDADEPVSLDPEGHALLNELAGKVPATELHSGVRQMLEGGNLSQDTVARLAEHLGVTPEQAGAKAAAFQEAYRRQANAAVGPRAEEIWTWYRENAPEDLREAVNSHLYEGKLGGYKALASRYMQNFDTINPDAILQSADGQKLKARLEPDGRVTLVHPQHGRIYWSTWVKGAKTKPHFTK